MHCPACTHELTAIAAADLVVEVCRGGCGGIWFDNRELRHVDGAFETVASDLLAIRSAPGVIVDPGRRRCPKCPDTVMMRHAYSPRRPVEIDECPACGGIWLDSGELARLRTETAQSAEDQTLRQEYAEEIAVAEVESTVHVARDDVFTNLMRVLNWHIRG